MANPPNGCVLVSGDFAPADFSGADFNIGSLVCGPYFTQAQGEYQEVQAQQVYSQVQAQQIMQEN